MSEIQGKRILIVDDDRDSLDMLKQILDLSGARVYTAFDGQDALHRFYTRRPDLVFLDLMMPKVDGWHVCRKIRQLSDVPLIILTALDQREHIVRGLDCGADDYITKPFDIDVLLARARAVLRRSELFSTSERPIAYDDGYLTVESRRRSVLVRGEPVKLWPTGYRLLTYLLQNADRVLTYRQILRHVWGTGYGDHPEYVHAYVWHLRQKLEPDPSRPRYFLSERGLGYCFETHTSPPTPLPRRSGRDVSSKSLE